MVSDNKRIAKNALFLYIRTFVILLISLYTVRVILNVLGFSDYGIYNVIGGIVAIFTFLSNTLTSVSQRYFSFYLGLGDAKQIQKCYSHFLLIFIILTLFIVFSLESIGLWWLYHELNIPPEKMNAATAVFHYSVAALAFNFILIPSNSLIVAHEKMDFYSYVSIFEAILKLAIAFILVYVDYDSLKLYALLITIVAFLKYAVYHVYVKINFAVAKIIYSFQISFLKELFGYIGWNIIGVMCGVFKNQGIVLLVNSFFGPIVNAALAIGSQIYIAFNQFTSSFIMAVQPQIIKKYAENDLSRVRELVKFSSRFSYYLLLLFVVPCVCELKYVLLLWLGDYPAKTVVMTELLLITAIIESQVYPLATAIQASGRVKNYNIITGVLTLTIIPVSYILLQIGGQPEIILIVVLIITFLIQIPRLIIVRRCILMPIASYIKEVFLNEMLVTAAALIMPIVIVTQFPICFLRFVCTISLSLICTFVAIYFIGLNKAEKERIQIVISNKIFKNNV